MNTTDEIGFNVIMGKRLYTIRTLRRLSQERLGMLIGVSGQQIYKYETGESKLTAEALYKCAGILKVPVEYFYGEDDDQSRFDKSILHIAAEIQELPQEVRKGIYGLSRLMNKYLEDIEQRKEKQAA